MTRLREMMLEELQRRNYSQDTTRHYIRTVEDFARRFKCQPLPTPITMENMAASLLADGLATKDEVESLTSELYSYAHTPGTIGTTPRIVEVCGVKSVLSESDIQDF